MARSSCVAVTAALSARRSATTSPASLLLPPVRHDDASRPCVTTVWGCKVPDIGL